MRHLIDPADFTLDETLRLMDLADRIHDDPAAYKDVCLPQAPGDAVLRAEHPHPPLL